MDSHDASTQLPSGDFVQSLARGLSVIKAFSADAPSMTLTEVAARTGMTKAAARRFLLTLTELGYLRTIGRDFTPTARLLELGYGYLSSFPLATIAQPHMEQLVTELRESCSIAVLDGSDLIYVARTTAPRMMTITRRIGTRLPAHCTSMGRVLLAGLPDDRLETLLAEIEMKPLTERTITHPEELHRLLRRIRKQGWAIVDQELEDGVRSIAAPLHSRDEQVIAAINVATHSARVRLADLRERFVPVLLASARDIDTELEAIPPDLLHAQ